MSRVDYYTLRVRPQSELEVAKGIIAAGWEKRGGCLIVPIGKHWVRKHAHTKQRRKAAYALYPRYLFVALTRWDDYYWIKATPVGHNVQGFIGRRGGPEPVSAKDLAFLQALPGMPIGEAATGTNVHRALRVGDTAELVDGALAGQQGEVVEIDEKRVKMMLWMLDSMRVVNVRASSVNPV